MGITLYVSVIPAKAGFVVMLEYMYGGNWYPFYDDTTDENGKITFTAAASSYPMTMRVSIEAGQVVDGVEYEGYVSQDLVLRDNVSYNISLYPKPLTVVKKPTTLTIDVYPTEGVPPYDVMITTYLTSLGVEVGYKLIRLYKNDAQIDSRATDSGGKAEFTDTVTNAADYYAYFAGDSEYEGCSTAPGGGLAGLGILVLLWLIMEAK